MKKKNPKEKSMRTHNVHYFFSILNISSSVSVKFEAVYAQSPICILIYSKSSTRLLLPFRHVLFIKPSERSWHKTHAQAKAVFMEGGVNKF